MTLKKKDHSEDYEEIHVKILRYDSTSGGDSYWQM